MTEMRSARTSKRLYHIQQLHRIINPSGPIFTWTILSGLALTLLLSREARYISVFSRDNWTRQSSSVSSVAMA